MASASNLRTSLRRHNVIDARNVFANKSIGEMIGQDHNAFPCNVMQTIQDSGYGFVKLKAMFKQHVNMDICSFHNGFKQLRATKFMQEF